MSQTASELLSAYQPLDELDADHGVQLVKRLSDGHKFVMKGRRGVDREVYEELKQKRFTGVPVIEQLIVQGDTLYVIEEYVTGVCLRKILDQGKIDEQLTIKRGRQLCAILAKLHTNQPPIVHRDIKPDNIIVRPDGSITLIDFGAARLDRPGVVHDTALIGTNGYAAPEQYGFAASSPAADIYAVGVLLNEMATGQLPSQRHEDGALGAVISRCLRMDPHDRYQDVGQLDTALQDVANHVSPGINGWLPPGLRSRKPLIFFLGIIWYAIICLGSSAITLEGGTESQLIAMRCFFFTLLIIETLWFGNYRGVWHTLPLSDSPRRGTRLLGVVLWGFALFATLFIAMAFIFSMV